MKWITLLALLCVVACAYSQPLAAPTARSKAIHTDLDTILSDREYRTTAEETGIVQSIGKSIMKVINKLLDPLRKRLDKTNIPDVGAMPRWVAITILAVFGVLLALLIVICVRKVKLGRFNKEKAKPQVSEELDLETATLYAPRDWITLADIYAKRGDWRHAYRCAFVAILVSFDRNGYINYDKARTNGEYSRALRGNDLLYRYFAPLALKFDVNWYGHRSIGEHDYQQMLEAHNLMPQREQQPVV